MRVQTVVKSMRILLLAGVAVLALSACASNRAGIADPITTGAIQADSGSLAQLAARYKARPRDKVTIIYYAAALRAVGQPEQAVSVLEAGITAYPKDIDIKIAFAKALTAAGRFDQALNVADAAIDPASPDWNALLVKGAILDQNGRNADARALYTQALLIAPGEASLEANMGLSFAMTNELGKAEQHLRKAVAMRGATSQIRQNLALVIGLQGRFEECRELFARDLPPDQVEANMAYIRALLTQQNRWDLIKGSE
jgi:Flp pilus assembly protein TadD